MASEAADSRQRGCKEACNSIPVVLYFLRHDFLGFWYGGPKPKEARHRIHAEIWAGHLLRVNENSPVFWFLEHRAICSLDARRIRAVKTHYHEFVKLYIQIGSSFPLVDFQGFHGSSRKLEPTLASDGTAVTSIATTGIYEEAILGL